jgi:hypothetical protein
VDVERLLTEEDEGWHALEAVFARIPADRIEDPTLTAEGWSPKDAMFHVAAWMAEAGLRLEQMRAGTFDPDDDPSPDRIERMNAAWLGEGRAMDRRTVRAELAASRVRMRIALGELPEVTPIAWEWFDESGPRHYRDHAGQLSAWLGDPAG